MRFLSLIPPSRSCRSRRVDDQRYAVGKITKLLHKAYRQEVNAYVANVRAEGPSLWGYE